MLRLSVWSILQIFWVVEGDGVPVTKGETFKSDKLIVLLAFLLITCGRPSEV